MIEYALAGLLGFAGGALGGMLGVGGGIIFVPALAIVLGETQIHAEATSLVAIVGVAIVGAWRQNRYGNVRVADGVLLGALSPLGVLIGVLVSNAVSERTLEVGFAVLLIFVAAQLMRRTPARSADGGRSKARARARP